MGTYSTSDGERFTREQIERKIRKAKQQLLENQIREYGYNFCEDCGRNANAGYPLDCSHNISVKESLESGRAEESWDYENNMKVRCRPCHQGWDGTELKLNWML